jgi:hypothetical protein
MSLNFIPTVWAARLLSALEKALVFGQTGVVNREYEGEIQNAGDSVKIATIGDITVGTYTKDSDMTVQTLDDADQMLVINQQKYFNFIVDDIDKAQQNVNTLDEAMRRSGYNLKDLADQFIAGHYVYAPADTGVGDDTTPLLGLAANVAYQLLVDLGVKLDERDVPSDGRFVIIPPFLHGALLKDDRFVKTGGDKAEMRLVNGVVGEAAGFTVLKSNNVPNTSATKYKVIAGHPMAFSYAEQIVKVKTYDPEKRFGTGVKGLHVYGGKLIRPQAWAVGTVNNAAA